jgi:hypothetical protein
MNRHLMLVLAASLLSVIPTTHSLAQSQQRLSLGVDENFGKEVIKQMDDQAAKDQVGATDSTSNADTDNSAARNSTDVPVADDSQLARIRPVSGGVYIGPPARSIPMKPSLTVQPQPQYSAQSQQRQLPIYYAPPTQQQPELKWTFGKTDSPESNGANRSPANFTEMTGGGPVDAGETGAIAGQSEPPANAWVGSRRLQLNVPQTDGERWPARNQPGVVSGRSYTDHAFDDMQNRGLTPSIVEETINHGEASPGDRPERTQYSHPENQTTVITEGSGKVISAWPGYSAPTSTDVPNSPMPEASPDAAGDAGDGDGQ